MTHLHDHVYHKEVWAVVVIVAVIAILIVNR